MTSLVISEFGGIAPRIHPHKLADKLAQVSQNCLLERGTLRPLREPRPLGTILSASTGAVFNRNGEWLQYPAGVSLTTSPIANDTFNRVFLTDSTFPKVRVGLDNFKLGIPRPLQSPSAENADQILDNPDNLLEVETVYYTVTIIDDFGAEGPPSSPSNGVQRFRDTPITVGRPVYSSSLRAITEVGGAKWRIYRSNTGTDDTNFQFVADVPLATASYFDEVPNAELQEFLPSATWTPPPDDNTTLWPDGPLQGLALGANGVMAGFAKNTVYFCEPYLPHAWPVEYSISIRHEILGVVWIAAGLLVVTDGTPVIISGSHPSSMSVYIPEKGWACSSGASLVDMGGWAMYTSPDGLVSVEGQRFTLVTENLITNNQWDSLMPSGADIHAGNAEGRYVLFFQFPASGANGALIFDPTAGVDALTTTTFYSDFSHSNTLNGRLLVRDANNELAEFDYKALGVYSLRWVSKVFRMPEPTNFAYLEVSASQYPVTIKIRAGENPFTTELGGSGLDEVYNTAVTTRISPLPSGFLSTEWEVEIIGTSEVSYVALYEDLQEAN